MKRILYVLALFVLIVSSCGKSTVKDPIIKGYKIGSISDLSFGQGSATATLEVDLDIDNPGKLDYAINSLSAVVYGKNAQKFAEAALKEKASAAAGTSGYVPVFLDLKFTNPLAILSAGLQNGGDFNVEDYTADIDAVIQVGIFTKNIKKDGIPLAEIVEALKVAGTIKEMNK